MAIRCSRGEVICCLVRWKSDTSRRIIDRQLRGRDSSSVSRYWACGCPPAARDSTGERPRPPRYSWRRGTARRRWWNCSSDTSSREHKNGIVGAAPSSRPHLQRFEPVSYAPFRYLRSEPISPRPPSSAKSTRFSKPFEPTMHTRSVRSFSRIHLWSTSGLQIWGPNPGNGPILTHDTPTQRSIEPAFVAARMTPGHHLPRS